MRAIANERDCFVKTEGDIAYGSISADEASKYYRGEVVFNSEEDVHEPTLTVQQTLEVALSLKKPRTLPTKTKRAEYATDMTNRLLNTFGMPHTANTKVGNETVRGVSGGERKRVSLSEMLTTNAAVVCWDNSVRGLDSAVALRFIQVLRELSRSTGMANIVSIYQASQNMYDNFDRVIVIYEGQLVYSGTAAAAQDYFIEMGWHKKARQTTPDFLTACTSPNERSVRKGVTHQPPKTATEMAAYWHASPHRTKLLAEVGEYRAYHASSDDSALFRDAVGLSKDKATGKTNPFKVGFHTQVGVLVRRQIALMKADKLTFIVRVMSNILQATIIGAVCYKPAKNANGSYEIAGGVFFSVLYFTIFALGEIPPTVLGRSLLIKHRKLGHYNPAAKTLAEMVVDAPIYAFQTIVFSAILYFIIGLNAGARYFFTFFFIVYTSYMALAVMYRMIASWSPNMSISVRFGGLSLGVVLTAAGFFFPEPHQHKWISWLRRISPVAYALEALLANEFRTRTLVCSATDLVPHGAGYANLAYQGCTITGAAAASDTVPGIVYIAEKYGFLPGNIWRNVGILWAMYVIYTIMVILGSTLLIRDTGSASAKLFKRGASKAPAQLEVVKSHVEAERVLTRTAEADHEKEQYNKRTIFTFRDVRYSVQVNGAEKVLLNGVSGLVEPGKLTALMGASGAGKTTLLDNLAKRKTVGKIEGDLRVGGLPLDSSFSRRTGFVQQGDIHEPFSTIRECLQFSALLRMPATYSRQEKLDYAEEVLHLLELGPIADALVGNADVGGLGVEERKRLTIGVELAAKPEALLFLDEPTSGLDSQAAVEVVRFLHKIAASGLAVLCTIHQPSGDLFEMFDSVVLLAPGGRAVYVGETGANASTLTDYFGQYGVVTPADVNPAESVIELVAPVGGSKIDWAERWESSNEARNLLARIDSITSGNEHAAAGDNEASASTGAFATSLYTQTVELTKRQFKAQYRDGPYHLTKMVLLVFFGLFEGFFFYKLPHSIGGIEALTLSLLTMIQVGAPMMFSIALYYQQKMDIYVARERNGIYSWTSLVTSLILCELPALFIGYTLLFFCYNWTEGIAGNSSVSGLTWLLWMQYAVFTGSCGTLLGAVSPSAFSVPFVLSLVWNIYNALSWSLVTHPIMVEPFHSFFSWISPLRWYLGALMSNHIAPLVVTCTEDELTRFEIPSTATNCGTYAADFLATVSGYLANPEATTNCGYCSMSTGADYMSIMGYKNSFRWQSYGIMFAFLASNVAFIYAMTWWLRIRPLFKS